MKFAFHVICLLFVSFNLFAQKRGIGRMTWEFRDYGNSFSGPIPEKLKDNVYKELEIHLINTVPRQYFLDKIDGGYTIDLYRDIKLGASNKVITIDDNHFILFWGYEESYNRWDILNAFMDFGHDSSLSPNTHERFRDSPYPNGKFSWEPWWDFDEEEMYYSGALGALRKDENGVYYLSFKVTYIIYKE